MLFRSKYTIEPPDYNASTAYVAILKDNELIAFIPSERTGAGEVTLSEGFQFNMNSMYEAQVILNYGTGVEIRSEMVDLVFTDIEVKITTPPDNPDPSDDSFATNFSFLSDTTITAQATLNPLGDMSEIEWEVMAANTTSGNVTNQNPTDMKGPTFSFTPDPPDHPSYVAGTDCNNPGNGNCDRSNPLSYDIMAEFRATNDQISSDQNTFTQDQKDIIRQEYLNHERTIPGRGELQPPTRTTNFEVDDILRYTAYSLVIGTPAQLAQSIRDTYNTLINDDVQVVPLGTSGIDPMTVIVSPGADINTIGSVLDTAPCNGAPNPATCDDVVVNDNIVAGSNGVAETVAVNQGTDYGLNLTSAWRNPERNEAVGGVKNSRHQYGDGVDLVPVNNVPEKTLIQLNCILETAAQNVVGNTGDAFAEERATQRDCDDSRITHIHAER